MQGLGGGGLISMAHATIADVISPRERGRYQGYIAAVWGLAAVAGPVLGGLFADYLTWRWVFWINIPIGLAALVVAEISLRRLSAKRLRHKIDYLGAVLVLAAVCCLLLVTTMGGEEVPWTSPLILGLLIAAIVLGALCVLQERHASEPILPPRLFRNDIFIWANACNLLSALGMLGSIVFLPVFLQLVYRLPAGGAGLLLIPLTAANVAGAIMAGRLIARTGRYKLFPILGLGLSGLGSLLIATAGPATPLGFTAIYAAIAGLGTGFIGPAVLVSVQNAIDVNDLGAGTAAVNFFRSMGGSFGAALFGAVLIGRLGTLIAALPGHEILGSNPGVALIHLGSDALGTVPPSLQQPLEAAFTTAFHDVFLVAAGVFFAGMVCGVFLRELPLKTTPGLARQEDPGLAALSE